MSTSRRTHRRGRTVYRGREVALRPGACPQCGRVAGMTSTGRRRSHRDMQTGDICTGSGVRVAGAAQAVVLDELPPINLPPERTPPANPWSGKAKPTAPPICPQCGQSPRVKRNGSFVAHRSVVDDWTSPYCPGGSPKGRQ